MSHITGFHIPYLMYFKERGYEVHIITNSQGVPGPECCDKVFDLDFDRSPFAVKNVWAIKKAYTIMCMEEYDIIHCHTPMGGVLGRIAAAMTKRHECIVFYTAHGFHFYKGSSVLNWLCFYPVERILSYFSDCIITINNEDYLLARKHFASKSTKVARINGVGVDLTRFSPATESEKMRLRNQHGFEKDDVLLFYAAEFIPRKNHKFIIENVKTIAEQINNVKILLAGNGVQLEDMKQLVKAHKVEQCVKILGFRKDIPDLLKMSDVLISPSMQEGLPVNVIEGMACGLPVVATDIRGHNDLVKNDCNGWLFQLNNIGEFIMGVTKVLNNPERYQKYSHESIEIAKQYSLCTVKEQMKSIYEMYL